MGLGFRMKSQVPIKSKQAIGMFPELAFCYFPKNSKEHMLNLGYL